MSTRKTLDIDPAVSALLAKIEKLKTDNQLKLGEIVTETGITKLVDADELRDILIRERDRILVAGPTRRSTARPMGRFRKSRPHPARPTDTRTLSPAALAVRTSWLALQRSEQALVRLLKAKALGSRRDEVAKRNARTRHLIELGGLVVVARLADCLEDDRAALLGAFLMMADLLDAWVASGPASVRRA